MPPRHDPDHLADAERDRVLPRCLPALERRGDSLPDGVARRGPTQRRSRRRQQVEERLHPQATS